MRGVFLLIMLVQVTLAKPEVAPPTEAVIPESYSDFPEWQNTNNKPGWGTLLSWIAQFEPDMPGRDTCNLLITQQWPLSRMAAEPSVRKLFMMMRKLPDTELMTISDRKTLLEQVKLFNKSSTPSLTEFALAHALLMQYAPMMSHIDSETIDDIEEEIGEIDWNDYTEWDNAYEGHDICTNSSLLLPDISQKGAVSRCVYCLRNCKECYSPGLGKDVPTGKGTGNCKQTKTKKKNQANRKKLTSIFKLKTTQVSCKWPTHQDSLAVKQCCPQGKAKFCLGSRNAVFPRNLLWCTEVAKIIKFPNSCHSLRAGLALDITSIKNCFLSRDSLLEARALEPKFSGGDDLLCTRNTGFKCPKGVAYGPDAYENTFKQLMTLAAGTIEMSQKQWEAIVLACSTTNDIIDAIEGSVAAGEAIMRGSTAFIKQDYTECFAGAVLLSKVGVNETDEEQGTDDEGESGEIDYNKENGLMEKFGIESELLKRKGLDLIDDVSAYIETGGTRANDGYLSLSTKVKQYMKRAAEVEELAKTRSELRLNFDNVPVSSSSQINCNKYLMMAIVAAQNPLAAALPVLKNVIDKITEVLLTPNNFQNALITKKEFRTGLKHVQRVPNVKLSYKDLGMANPDCVAKDLGTTCMKLTTGENTDSVNAELQNSLTCDVGSCRSTVDWDIVEDEEFNIVSDDEDLQVNILTTLKPDAVLMFRGSLIESNAVMWSNLKLKTVLVKFTTKCTIDLRKTEKEVELIIVTTGPNRVCFAEGLDDVCTHSTTPRRVSRKFSPSVDTSLDVRASCNANKVSKHYILSNVRWCRVNWGYLGATETICFHRHKGFYIGGIIFVTVLAYIFFFYAMTGVQVLLMALVGPLTMCTETVFTKRCVNCGEIRWRRGPIHECAKNCGLCGREIAGWDGCSKDHHGTRCSYGTSVDWTARRLADTYKRSKRLSKMPSKGFVVLVWLVATIVMMIHLPAADAAAVHKPVEGKNQMLLNFLDMKGWDDADLTDLDEYATRGFSFIADDVILASCLEEGKGNPLCEESKALVTSMKLIEGSLVGQKLVNPDGQKYDLFYYIRKTSVNRILRNLYYTAPSKSVIGSKNQCTGNVKDACDAAQEDLLSKPELETDKIKAWLADGKSNLMPISTREQEDNQKIGCRSSGCMSSNGGAICFKCVEVLTELDGRSWWIGEASSPRPSIEFCFKIANIAKCKWLTGEQSLTGQGLTFITSTQDSLSQPMMVAGHIEDIKGWDVIHNKTDFYDGSVLFEGPINKKGEFSQKFGYPQFYSRQIGSLGYFGLGKRCNFDGSCGDLDWSASWWMNCCVKNTLNSQIKLHKSKYQMKNNVLMLEGVNLGMGQLKIRLSNFQAFRKDNRVELGSLTIIMEGGCFQCSKGFQVKITYESNLYGIDTLECTGVKPDKVRMLLRKGKAVEMLTFHSTSAKIVAECSMGGQEASFAGTLEEEVIEVLKEEKNKIKQYAEDPDCGFICGLEDLFDMSWFTLGGFWKWIVAAVIIVMLAVFLKFTIPFCIKACKAAKVNIDKSNDVEEKARKPKTKGKVL